MVLRRQLYVLIGEIILSLSGFKVHDALLWGLFGRVSLGVWQRLVEGERCAGLLLKRLVFIWVLLRTVIASSPGSSNHLRLRLQRPYNAWTALYISGALLHLDFLHYLVLDLSHIEITCFEFFLVYHAVAWLVVTWHFHQFFGFEHLLVFMSATFLH